MRKILLKCVGTGIHNDPKENKQRTPHDLQLKLKQINIEELNNLNLKQELEWKYENIQASKIEAKTSVSKIKLEENKEAHDIENVNMPVFLKEEEKITGSRKGTITHLCMQKLNPKEEYTQEKIEKLLETLVYKNIITLQEKEAINTKKIANLTKSSLWKELKEAKQIEKEKPFYINVKVSKIYETNIQESILVQGIIDLYYIDKDDHLVLVDYKTDYVQNENELIQKYKVQLELYKEALEKALAKKVDRVYIYSTYLDKEIKINF